MNSLERRVVAGKPKNVALPRPRPKDFTITREQFDMIVARLLRFKLYKWSMGIV
jgi:hypothetical protein